MKTTTIALSEETPLNVGDLERLRNHAANVLERLEQKIHTDCSNNSPHPEPWVGSIPTVSHSHSDDIQNSNDLPPPPPTTTTTTTQKSAASSFRKRYFDQHGFWVARGFCDSKETFRMKQAMARSVQNHWFPEGTTRTNHNQEQDSPSKQEKVTSFGTDAKSNEARGDPFLESADKVSYFAEPTALNTGSLRPEFCETHTKLLALNKAGHGLHLPPNFRSSSSSPEPKNHETENNSNSDGNSNIHEPFFNYTSSSKMWELVSSLGYRDPVVPQSMYIFKNPLVGGAVHSHQDSTFLYTTPRQTCLGLWLALDDATLQNGCLWVRPKSHNEPLRRQFLRNPKHREDNDEPKLTFEMHHEHQDVTWEGSLPPSVVINDSNSDSDKSNTEDEVSSMNFVPVEVKAGDLVVFCGTLDHFSLPNFSKIQRHTFQLHLVEGPNAGIEWSPSNWLQYDERSDEDAIETPPRGFLRLLDFQRK